MEKVYDYTKKVIPPKRVQEMFINGEEPPARYKARDTKNEPETVPPEACPIPVIDFGRLLSSSPEEEEKFKQALTTWGGFQAINHGIPTELMDEVRKVTREFYLQPMEEKNKLTEDCPAFQGYGSDPVPDETVPIDWFDRLFLTIFPEDERNYKYWPKHPPSFRDVVVEYCTKLRELGRSANKVMSRALNLPENCLSEIFGEKDRLQPSFNYYPPCKIADQVYGVKPHCDASGFTMIMPDEEGLQIFKDDKWYSVPKNPHVIVMIMADQMEIISNGVFKSVLHRVLINPEKDRISVNVFYTPEKGKEVGPPEELIKQHNKRVYKHVKDYDDSYYEYYNNGQTPLEAARA